MLLLLLLLLPLQHSASCEHDYTRRNTRLVSPPDTHTYNLRSHLTRYLTHSTRLHLRKAHTPRLPRLTNGASRRSRPIHARHTPNPTTNTNTNTSDRTGACHSGGRPPTRRTLSRTLSALTSTLSHHRSALLLLLVRRRLRDLMNFPYKPTREQTLHAALAASPPVRVRALYNLDGVADIESQVALSSRVAGAGVGPERLHDHCGGWRVAEGGEG